MTVRYSIRTYSTLGVCVCVCVCVCVYSSVIIRNVYFTDNNRDLKNIIILKFHFYIFTYIPRYFLSCHQNFLRLIAWHSYNRICLLSCTTLQMLFSNRGNQTRLRYSLVVCPPKIIIYRTWCYSATSNSDNI